MMRKTTQLLVLAGVIAAPTLVMSGTAYADEAKSPISANVGLVTDYAYRGISQTNSKPALQGGFDYAHSSGFYAGVWGSNISWLSDLTDTAPGGIGNVSSSLELDGYVGFKGDIGTSGFGYDVGVLTYYYPGDYPANFTSPDTTELYVAGSYSIFSLKYSHAVTNLFGAPDSKNSGYLDAALNFTLPGDVGLGLHVGRQQVNCSGCTDYTDYKISLSKEYIGLNWGVAYVDTSLHGDKELFGPTGRSLSDGRFIVSVSKSF
jgi:uncharacterized protein (TIGR02001 family)